MDRRLVQSYVHFNDGPPLYLPSLRPFGSAALASQRLSRLPLSTPLPSRTDDQIVIQEDARVVLLECLDIRGIREAHGSVEAHLEEILAAYGRLGRLRVFASLEAAAAEMATQEEVVSLRFHLNNKRYVCWMDGMACRMSAAPRRLARASTAD